MGAHALSEPIAERPTEYGNKSGPTTGRIPTEGADADDDRFGSVGDAPRNQMRNQTPGDRNYPKRVMPGGRAAASVILKPFGDAQQVFALL